MHQILLINPHNHSILRTRELKLRDLNQGTGDMLKSGKKRLALEHENLSLDAQQWKRVAMIPMLWRQRQAALWSSQ